MLRIALFAYYFSFLKVIDVVNGQSQTPVFTKYISTRELPVGCSTGGNNCSTTQQCAGGCFDCYDGNIYKCNVCSKSYFLFTLPTDNPDLSLRKGDQVCVSCPFQTYADSYAIYCGDCIENSGTWENTRSCSYDYIVKGQNALSGVYQQINKTETMLFFVIPIKYDQTLNTTNIYAPYTTELCDGCLAFCPGQTLLCQPVNPSFLFDSTKQFSSCLDGYSYNIAIDGCDACPDNCKACTMSTESFTDDTDETTYITLKECVHCNNGFSLFQGYPKILPGASDEIDTINHPKIDIRCEPCFVGCLNCYFGSDTINLNLHPDQWKSYTAQMGPTDTWDVVVNRLIKSQIAVRCTSCQQSITGYFLPHLNMSTCIQCMDYCGQCEYVSYQKKYQLTPKQYPTLNNIPIILATEQANYILRCRKCTKYQDIQNFQGLQCDENNQIHGCSIAFYALQNQDKTLTGTTSLDSDFTPAPLGLLQCALCLPGFQLSQTKLNCTNVTNQTNTVQNCLIYQTNSLGAQICSQCIATFTLNENGQCISGCAFQIGDFFCTSCYSYHFINALNVNTFKQKCLACVYGYFTDVLSGLCSPCSQDPSDITCGQCQQYSFKQIYTNNIMALRPKYSDSITQYLLIENISDIKNNDDVISQVICNSCAPLVSFNAISGYCESCKSNCMTCDVNAPTAFCAACNPDVVGRSATILGNDCLPCPQNCIGCRNRVASELQSSNQFFAPTNAKLQLYSRICYTCTQKDSNNLNVTYNSAIGRCISCATSSTGCYQSTTIDIFMYCVTGSAQKFLNNDPLANAYTDLSSYYLSKTSLFAKVQFVNVENDDNYFIWNNMGIDTMTVNINLIQNSNDQTQNECVMSKDTYITTGISKNVFSIQNLKLNILVRNEALAVVPGQSNIILYVFRNLFIEYFNDVTISGLQISPSVDYNYKYPLNMNQDLKKNPLGIILNMNTKCSLRLNYVQILQTQAKQIYDNKSAYISPQDPTQVALKKFCPFFFNLLNIYNLEMTNVSFTSFSYLVDKAVKFNGMPFTLVYDSPQTMTNITFTNVVFQDFSIEARYILQLQKVAYISIDPSIIQFFTIDGLVVQDSYFINGAGLFGQNIAKSDSCGVIDITGFKEIRDYHNNSNGMFNFQTAQSMVVKLSFFQSNFVNFTYQFYSNTMDMSDVTVLDSVYKANGRFINTQEKATMVQPGKGVLSGITFNLGRIRFNNITCLSLNCLVNALTPTNVYQLQINVSLSSIEIGNTVSSGFAPNLIDSANSALIFISKIYSVTINNFLSVNNKNLTILNINDVQLVNIDTYTCLSDQNNISLNTSAFFTSNVYKDNMCLYVSNFYQNVTVSNVKVNNLVGIDNSFLVFSSWDTLIYNTTQPGIQEKINIIDLHVSTCTIFTTQISSVSSSLFIESKQMQQVQLNYSSFLHNTQIQLPVATLTPSNPTVLTQSIVGNIFITDCFWIDNKAGGFGAVLYIQMGSGKIQNSQMIGSNWLRANEVFQLNSVSYGGHLYLQGYDLTIMNCSFQNASAVRGTGVYILSVADGLLTIQDTIFSNLLTPLTPAAESRGGCLYIDSSNSRLQMTMYNVSMSNCAVRGEGGCIYLNPSVRDQNVKIQYSTFFNCFSLAGSLLKVTFDKRTVETQIISISDSTIKQNYWDYVAFMTQVNNQNQPNGGLNAVEQYLFIQRSAVIEQDSGYIVINNVDVSEINFQGILSLFQLRQVNIQNMKATDSIIIYRPLIEILNPFLNPTVFQAISVLNITSYTPENINCKANASAYDNQSLYQSNLFKCNLMQIKIEYPDQLASPAIILVTSVTLKAPLSLSSISIDTVICNECFGGLISILGVYNGNPLVEMVTVKDFSCINSLSSYYGCLLATRLPIVMNSPDDTFLNITYASSYDLKYLQQSIGQSARLSARKKNRIIKKLALSQDDFDPEPEVKNRANLVVAVNTDQTPYLPSNIFAAHIRLQDVQLSGLNATYGGGISIIGLTANITNLESYQCHSIASGGSVYFQADPKIGGKVQQRLNLWNNLYVQGQAKIGGAIRTLQSGPSQTNKSQVFFLNNQATYYGSDVASYPSKIALVINGTTQKQLIMNFNLEWVAYPITMMSGQAFNIYQQQQVVFSLLGEDSQQVNYQSGTSANFQTNPSYHLSGSGKRDFTTDVQGFDFSNLVLNFDPYVYKTLEINVTSDAIYIPVYLDYPPYFLLRYDQNYTLQGRVRAVECSIGEAYDVNSGTCSPCGPGTYALQTKTQCTTMDQSVMNETYLNQISINIGFWRSDITIDKTVFCLNQPQNCQGGWNVGNDLCVEGNIGALCEACDWYGVRWGEPYSSGDKLSCVKCSASKFNAIIIGVLSVWTLYSICTSIQGTKESMELMSLAEICTKIGWCGTLRAGANKAVMMKMLTNYQQIVGVISQFQLTIPSTVVNSASTVGQPTSALGHSMECLLLNFTPGVDILYWKIIWSLIMQILYISAITLLMVIGHYTKKMEFKAQYVATMLLFMFIFLHPGYVQDFILLVSQRTISGFPWVQSNVSYRYDSWNHQRWMYGLGLPGLFIWAILFPFSFAYIVHNGAKQKKLGSIFFRNTWGFFYNEYRSACYYWEFIKIFQKELLIIILVYYTDDVIVKGILVFIIVYLYGRFTQARRPYDFQPLNRLDIWSTHCCALSIIIGVLIYRALQNGMTIIILLCYLVQGLLNAFFYLCIIYYLLQQYLILFAAKLDDMKDKIVEKKPEWWENPKYRPYLVNRTKLNFIAKQKWRDLALVVNAAVARYILNPSEGIVFRHSDQENLLVDEEYEKQVSLTPIEDVLPPVSANKSQASFHSDNYKMDNQEQEDDKVKYRHD